MRRPSHKADGDAAGSSAVAQKALGLGVVMRPPASRGKMCPRNAGPSVKCARAARSTPAGSGSRSHSSRRRRSRSRRASINTSRPRTSTMMQLTSHARRNVSVPCHAVVAAAILATSQPYRNPAPLEGTPWPAHPTFRREAAGAIGQPDRQEALIQASGRRFPCPARQSESNEGEP